MTNKSDMRVEDVLTAYAEGIDMGLYIIVRAVQKLPRSTRSSLSKLIAAIKASIEEEYETSDRMARVNKK